jgi:MFS family permease
VFIKPVSNAYDVSAVSISTVFSVMLFVFFAGAGIVSVYSSRFSSRFLLISCGILAALLSPGLYVVSSVVGLMIVFGLFGLSLGMAYVVLVTVVPQWFDRHRGLATGVTFTGIGLSLFVMPPAWELAFAQLGVRQGFAVLSTTSAFAIMVAGIVCRRPPWTERVALGHEALSAWLVTLVHSSVFRLLFVGIGLGLAWYYLLAAYLIDLFIFRGVGESTAVLGFGLIGAVSILSRLGSGVVADMLGFRRTFLASIVCAIAGSVLLFFPPWPIMALSVVMFGIALGGVATTHVPFLLDIYGREKDIAVIGVFNISFGVFGLTAPPVATLVLSYTENYNLLIGLTLLLSMVAFQLIAKSEKRIDSDENSM